MDVVELLPVEIAEALERGATVVTGNQRAAGTLRRGFDKRQEGAGGGGWRTAAGRESWRPAAVLAWDAWVVGLWREMLVQGQAEEMVLNRTQEHAVWRGIL